MAPAASDTVLLAQDQPQNIRDDDGTAEAMRVSQSAMEDMHDEDIDRGGSARIGILEPLEEEPPIVFERPKPTRLWPSNITIAVQKAANVALVLAPSWDHRAFENRSGFLLRTKEEIVLDPHQTGLPVKFTEFDEDGVPIVTLEDLSGPTVPLPALSYERETSRERGPPSSSYSLVNDPELIPPLPEAVGRMPYIAPDPPPPPPLEPHLDIERRCRDFEQTEKRPPRLSSIRTTTSPPPRTLEPPSVVPPRFSRSAPAPSLSSSQTPMVGDRRRDGDSISGCDVAHLPDNAQHRLSSHEATPPAPPSPTHHVEIVTPPFPRGANDIAVYTHSDTAGAVMTVTTAKDDFTPRSPSLVGDDHTDDRTAEFLSKVRSLSLNASESSLHASLPLSPETSLSAFSDSSCRSMQSSPVTSAYSPVPGQSPLSASMPMSPRFCDEPFPHAPERGQGLPRAASPAQNVHTPPVVPSIVSLEAIHFESFSESPLTTPPQPEPQAQTTAEQHTSLIHKHRDHGQITLHMAPQPPTATASSEPSSTASDTAPTPGSKPGPASGAPRKVKVGPRIDCPFRWCKTTFRSNYELNRHLRTAAKHVERAEDEKVFCEMCGQQLARKDSKQRHEGKIACWKRRIRRKPVHPMARVSAEGAGVALELDGAE
ncbi:hypothetical protein LshimejAT787_1403190 [Lyophyllum shimeji]|uniref:C2H2-type domain-containing protein n=1 Tax=Lyophyllum shimeji TaxID=47721 RepID=A0A9P3PVP2_LYOSH|nr:hypothetical protein LshimejAT787_1403190 [Lyophyllum shimeji]